MKFVERAPRIPAWLCALALALPAAFQAHSQSAAAAAAASAPGASTPTQRVEVTGQALKGYTVSNSGVGTKIDAPIRDVPQAIEVRTRQVLDDLGGTQTSYEVGKTVAGVFNADNGQGDPGRNVPTFFFRGYSNTGVYLKDGRMVNGWMSTMDMANVERVEFLKGPASTLYGGTTYNGNIGGVVNYVSKRPMATQPAALEFSAGSYDFYRATMDLGGATNEDKTVTYRLNGAAEKGGSFRDFAKHDSQFIAPVASLRLSTIDTLTILAEVNRSHEIPSRTPLTAEAFEVASSKNFIDASFAKFDIAAGDIAAQYEHILGNDWRLNIDLGKSHSRTQSYDSWLYYSPGASSTLALSRWTLVNDQSSLDLRLSGRLKTGSLDHQLLLGIAAQRNKYRADSDYGWNDPTLDLAGTTLAELVMPSPGSSTATFAAAAPDPGTFKWATRTTAFYAQDLIAFGDSAKLLMGLRHDRLNDHTEFAGSFANSVADETYGHTTPRLGLVYQPTRTASIYLVRAESFVPNSGVTLSGTRPPPERGLLGEIGAKLTLGSGITLDLAWFDLRQRNMTFTDPADPSGNAVIVTGETRSRGVELDLNGQLTQNLRVNVAATALKARVSQGDPNGSIVAGQEFGGVPRKTLNVLVVQSMGGGGAWEIGGGVFFASQTWADGANTFRVPAFVQWDLMAACRIDARTRLQVNVKNATNRHNYTSNGWGWVNPGEPASLFATLRHEL